MKSASATEWRGELSASPFLSDLDLAQMSLSLSHSLSPSLSG